MSIGFLPSFFSSRIKRVTGRPKFLTGLNQVTPSSSFFLKLKPAQALGLPSPKSIC